MQLIRRLTGGAAAFLAYVVTTLIFHWPLPARLGSALTGPVGGDTGVYVWNLWVFRHEIVTHRRFPLFTQEILALTPPVDLSLHNYTLFANALAFPLLPVLGVTATFNVIFLTMTALTAWTMFLLAKKVVGRTFEAWLAGLLFGFSPILVARSTAHFSLVAAAPLPVFVLCLMRLERQPTTLNAMAAGATIAWAATCDPYFAVYCLLIAACYAAARALQVRRRSGPPASETVSRVLTAATVMVFSIVVALAVVINVIRITEVSPFGSRIELSMHAPVLVLMALAAAAAVARFRPVIAVQLPMLPLEAMRAAIVAATTCLLLLSPLLFLLYRRLAAGDALHGPIYWRSGPKGVDLLAFFTPNPANRLVGMPWRAWLTGQNNGYVENVAALTIVAMLLVGLAIWKFSFRPPRLWMATTLFFGALALGPFVNVGGMNTYVLGPWAVLRYVPVLSAARMPARFAIVAMMAFAVLFALALVHIGERRPQRRRLLLAVVAVLLAFELAPLPRQLHAAPIPDFYRIVRNDPRDVRVMAIPFGIADGERGEGRYDGASQYYQTFHQKEILGGGLSRISPRARQRLQRFPVIRVLLRASEHRDVSREEIARAKAAAPNFITRSRLGYVVIDTLAAPPGVRRLTIEMFNLEKIAESNGRELYRPVGTAIASQLQ